MRFRRVLPAATTRWTALLFEINQVESFFRFPIAY